MTVKEKLQGYSYAIEYSKELEERLKEIRDSMTSIKSMNYEEVSASSGVNDRIANAIAKLVEVEHTYLDKIADIAEMEKEINDLLSHLTPKEQKLIRLRYMQSKSWEDICGIMFYSWQGVHKLHSNTLDKLENSRLK